MMDTEEEILASEAGTPITITGPIDNDKIFDLLFKEEDITWQTMLYELVKTNQMDPWDIDISLLAKNFIDMIKKLKDMDFRISGKIVLASAILLKMKSNKLLFEDIAAFDNLLYSGNEVENEILDDADGYIDYAQQQLKEKGGLPQIFPKTPQPRKRKVSIFDLVKALGKALEVKNRRKLKIDTAPKVEVPKNHRDVSLVIKDVYDQVKKYFSSQNTLTFAQLIPSDSREDKIFTFIPLLHLRNAQKVDLHQQIHFGDIEIELMKQKAPKAS
ncbi:segregation/condensation protein A [Candidatus Woesearchaeota archaeon]|nr:segregation/condensation protein A [Candidatus Woesearchaeota archaeon]